MNKTWALSLKTSWLSLLLQKVYSLLPLVRSSGGFLCMSLSYLLPTSLVFWFVDQTEYSMLHNQTMVKSRKNLGMALNYHPVPDTQ